MASALPYEVIYHAGIQGRAEFIRLYLEATGTPYIDHAQTVGQACIAPYMDGSFEGAERIPQPFAPPILRHGELVINQTANILLYLSKTLPALEFEGAPSGKPRGGMDSSMFYEHGLVLTMMDFVSEASTIHDTHHPTAASSYYDAQRNAAVSRSKNFRDERVPKYLSLFETNIAKAGNGFLLASGYSHVDLMLFQIVDGLLFAFPRLMSQLQPDYPLVWALHKKVKATARIQAYLSSDRRIPYNQMDVFRRYPELDNPE